MATIKNTTLTIEPGGQSDKLLVKVTATTEFTQADKGQWLMSIKLYGDDKGEGGLVLPGYSGSQLLYTFSFPTSVFLPMKRDYMILQSTPGEKTIAESREIERAKLDEDPKKLVGKPPYTIPLYQPDEVFAVVTLSREFKSNVCTGQDFAAKAQADSNAQAGVPTS